MNSRFVRPVRRAVAGVACAALLAVTAGCTDNQDASKAPEPASTGEAATLDAKPVPIRVRVTRVSGKLKKASKESLEHSIGRTVGAYWEAAYLGGTYPRSDFGNAFPGFSKGAAKKATKDRGLLTNSGLGPSIASVAPKQKRVWLSVLAPNKVAAGVTARIRLVYVADRAEETDQRVTVSGRLLLTRKKSGGWQIFGYDVKRSARPAAKGTS